MTPRLPAGLRTLESVRGLLAGAALDVVFIWGESKTLCSGRTGGFVDDPDQNGAGIGVLEWPGGGT